MKISTFMIGMTAALWLCTMAAPLLADDAKGNLVLTITGFDSDEGSARVALFSSRQEFETDKRFMGFDLEITDRKVHLTIPDIPFGTYAVKLFHDENGNNELDTRIFGIPAERYGFSNNARGKLGPPSFDEAKFDHLSAVTSLQIEIK